ncbi:MAG TPA: hypothetical protein VG759_07375 [Candidatus Angelobacter sp.]|nr:hypothetical protein [Candidatus Angelobacter sp.]
MPAALSLLVFVLDLLTKRREERQRKKEEKEAKTKPPKPKLAEDEKQKLEKQNSEEGKFEEEPICGPETLRPYTLLSNEPSAVILPRWMRPSPVEDLYFSHL